MKKRNIYLILFGFPGSIISIILSLIVFGFATGFLWLFIFGDNAWPSSSENLISIEFALVFLMVWFAFTALGFVCWKPLENDPVLNKQHIMVSNGVSVLLLLMIVFYLFRVGNIRLKSDSVH